MKDDFVSSRHLTLVCGSGGVGKTTLAALMAYAHARAGQKVAVLTIDPARRLKTALNLDNLDSEPVLVKSFPNGGEFYALMLNSSIVWDEVVATFASQNMDKIQSNRFYKSLKSNLAGASEFMAVELIYKLMTKYSYTSLIVDTAPSANSVDFLSAPGRLIGFLDTPVYSLLKKVSGKLPLARFTNKFLGGKENILDSLIGSNALSDFSQFMESCDSVKARLIEHSKYVEKLLSSDRTGMIVVGQADDRFQYDIETFLKSKISMDFIVLNRVRPYLMHAGQERNVDDAWELIKAKSFEREPETFKSTLQGVKQEIFQAREEINIRALISGAYSTPVIEIPEAISEKKGVEFLEDLYELFLRHADSA